MARRKKRKRPLQKQKAIRKKEEKFYPAFSGLSTLKRRKPECQGPFTPPLEDDETQYFLDAMSDVKSLSEDKNIITHGPSRHIRPTHPANNDELEGVAHLLDLVSGNAEMDISFSDEYIEGSVEGFSPKLMDKLKKGRFPVQDYIDLHGLTRQDAEIRVRDFLLKNQRLGMRCVLVVHGRGLNSEDNIPVLKERLPIWLSRGPAKKIVLAFSTARPYDGGRGAIYILLKKKVTT